MLQQHTCDGFHPCAFCTSKHTILCKGCAERYEFALLEEDVCDEFLFKRDMADTSLSGKTPAAH